MPVNRTRINEVAQVICDTIGWSYAYEKIATALAKLEEFQDKGSFNPDWATRVVYSIREALNENIDPVQKAENTLLSCCGSILVSKIEWIDPTDSMPENDADIWMCKIGAKNASYAKGCMMHPKKEAIACGWRWLPAGSGALPKPPKLDENPCIAELMKLPRPGVAHCLVSLNDVLEIVKRHQDKGKIQ